MVKVSIEMADDVDCGSTYVNFIYWQVNQVAQSVQSNGRIFQFPEGIPFSLLSFVQRAM